MGIGRKLVALREEKKMKQKEVASILGVSNSAFNRFELNERMPEVETLRKLATFYDCSVDYLLGRTNIRNHHLEMSTSIDETWPEMAKVLHRSRAQLTPAEKERLVRIMEAATEVRSDE